MDGIEQVATNATHVAKRRSTRIRGNRLERLCQTRLSTRMYKRPRRCKGMHGEEHNSAANNEKLPILRAALQPGRGLSRVYGKLEETQNAQNVRKYTKYYVEYVL